MAIQVTTESEFGLVQPTSLETCFGGKARFRRALEHGDGHMSLVEITTFYSALFRPRVYPLCPLAMSPGNGSHLGGQDGDDLSLAREWFQASMVEERSYFSGWSYTCMFEGTCNELNGTYKWPDEVESTLGDKR